MRESRNYIKISSANAIKVFSLSFLLVCIGIGIFILKEGEVYQSINLLIIISLCILVYCLADLWRRRIILGKCDFEAQEAFILKLLNRKRNIKSMGLHLELLYVSLVLGRYGWGLQEIEILHRSAARLNNRQRLRLQLLSIDYRISVNEHPVTAEELEDAERLLEQLSGLKKGTREKIRAGIRLRRYFIEKKWEDMLKLLEDREGLSKYVTVFEQVSAAYLRGKCYWQLERYAEAYDELRFVVARGGNTKYVVLANALMEKMPDKNLCENRNTGKIQKKKYSIDKRILFLGVNCFVMLLLCGAAHYCSCGSSIEEAYGRRYLCGEDRPFVIYSENISDFELALLNERDKAGYCLLQKTSNSGYRIVDSFRVDKYTEENMRKELKRIGKGVSESMEQFYQESSMELEVWAVITEFYKKNKVFYQGDAECVGISYSPLVENVTVNGNPLRTEQVIDQDGRTVYLWRIRLDLEENIRVVYRGN